MSRLFPRLRRDLELVPVDHEGQEMLLVRDHLELVPAGMALRPESFGLLSLLQEPRDSRLAAEELTRMAGGRLVTAGEIESVIDQLESAWLLETDRFLEERARIRAGYAGLAVRESTLAGTAYPEDPAELAARLGEIMVLAEPAGERPAGRLAGLVAPHIDLAAGERVYARAYRSLDGPPPERVVILGVGHQLADGLFSLTSKDFATPLGILANDREASRSLLAAAGDMASADDYVHKSEHSIEFQAVFLRGLLGGAAPAVVPVLCGSAALMLPELSRQAFLDKAGPFLEALSALTKAPDSRTLVLAGVDLCHIGPKFGSQQAAAELEEQASRHEAALLERAAAVDPDGFWRETARVQDVYNICGLTALAALLEALPDRCRGEVLDYEMWREAATSSAVGFAAAAFRAPEG